VVLLGLIRGGTIDPSNWEHQATSAGNQTLGNATNPLHNVHLPLSGVCRIQANAGTGVLLFIVLCLFCLAFVIFVTSAQSFTGFRQACGCCSRCAAPTAPAGSFAPSDGTAGGGGSGNKLGSRRVTSIRASRNGFPVDLDTNESIPLERADYEDRVKGKCALFAVYIMVVLVVVVFFTVTPFYRVAASHGERDDALWRQACNENDVETLQQYGIS